MPTNAIKSTLRTSAFLAGILLIAVFWSSETAWLLPEDVKQRDRASVTSIALTPVFFLIYITLIRPRAARALTKRFPHRQWGVGSDFLSIMALAAIAALIACFALA